MELAKSVSDTTATTVFKFKSKDWRQFYNLLLMCIKRMGKFKKRITFPKRN